MSFVLAIDQGTTSSRAILFGRDGAVHAIAQQEFRHNSFRNPARSSTSQRKSGQRRSARRDDGGPEDGRRHALPTSPRSASPTNAKRSSSGTVRRVGLCPARSSGKTAARPPICEALRAQGARTRRSRARPDLVLDPYFTGTKAPGSSITSARAPAPPPASSLRDHRFLAGWSLTGGHVARDRRKERVSHAAFEHPHRRVGRRAPRNPPRATVEAAL